MLYKIVMIYEMNLQDKPFKTIKRNHKVIEMRLNDERRKKLKVNDLIIFTNNLTNEKLEVIILDIKKYHDFYELYSNYKKEELGYLKNEIADPKDMYKYYSKEQILKYGVIAIKIKTIDKLNNFKN